MKGERDGEAQCKQNHEKKCNSLQLKSECKMPISLRFSSFYPLSSPHTAHCFPVLTAHGLLCVCVCVSADVSGAVDTSSFFEFIQLGNSLFILYSRNGLVVNISA